MTITPLRLLVRIAEMSAAANLMQSSTPASSAFAFAAAIAFGLMSRPKIFGLHSLSIASNAAFRSSFQRFAGIASHSSLTKLRLIPGAMFFAINAASIGMVPEPQHGSDRILSLFQNES